MGLRTVSFVLECSLSLCSAFVFPPRMSQLKSISRTGKAGDILLFPCVLLLPFFRCSFMLSFSFRPSIYIYLTYLPAYLSSPSIHPPTHPPIHPSIHPFNLSIYFLYPYLSIYLCIYLSIYVYIYLSKRGTQSTLWQLRRESRNF